MAYTTATVVQIETEADGRVHINIQYAGDAGEPAIVKPYYIQTTTTPPVYQVRAEAIQQLAIFNQSRALQATYQPQLPLPLDVTTPIPPATVGTPAMSYMAATLPFTPGATPQDVFSIIGSATKTVTIQRTGIVTVQTTAGVNPWQLIARSTANTNGTSAPVSAVPFDGANTAATASVIQYTANSTVFGTLVGRLWAGRVPSPAPATAGIGNPNIIVSFDRGPNPKLSGVAQSISWNFGGAALPTGLSVIAFVWWTETV